MINKLLLVLSLVVVNVAVQPIAMAQSIIITSPLQDFSFAEGDDFFTTVLKDPIDFDKRRDFLWEENWVDPSIGVADGVYTAQSAGNNYIFPLFHGFKDTVNIGNYGANFPIDTKKYTGFSVISSISDGDKRNFKTIRWSRDVDFPELDNSGYKKSWLDAVTTHTQPQLKFGNDEVTFDIIDLSDDSDWTSQPVKSLLYDQATGNTSGVSESFSSVRVYDPLSSEQYTVKWNYSSLTTTGIPPKVNIYLDDNADGLDGIFMGRVPVNNNGSGSNTDGTGSFSFPLAALPPGEYYIYLKVFDAFGDEDTQLVSSGYTGKIIVNAKSQIIFKNPSYTSGADYATTIRQNAWDFNDSADIVNLESGEDEKQIKNELFKDGFFQGTAYIPDANRPSQTESDSQIWLNTGSISPKKFKYLTYEMEVFNDGYTTIEDKVRRGWILRAIWWQTNPVFDGGVTSDIVTYEGRKSYSVDLTDVVMADAEGIERKWPTLDFITQLRLDPLETDQDTIFRFYDVKLTANPEPDYETNTFTVEFVTTDKENDQSTVTIYLDTNNSGYDGVALATGDFQAGSNSLTFSSAAHAQGDYYLYAVVIDSVGNRTRTYADVPVTFSEESIQGKRTPRYRVYYKSDGHHHYTTDLNEYNVLESRGWIKEGISAYIYDARATLDGKSTVPYYRLYNPSSLEHFWTTSLNEYNVLATVGWKQEGIDGHIFKEEVPGSSALYRLFNRASGLHHWTRDSNERTVLIANHGWVGEGIAGYVFSSLE